MVYTQVSWFVSEVMLPPKSPNLGDFELELPQSWGLGGEIQYFEVAQEMYVHRSLKKRAGGSDMTLLISANLQRQG
jgi:hypothetical protein